MAEKLTSGYFQNGQQMQEPDNTSPGDGFVDILDVALDPIESLLYILETHGHTISTAKIAPLLDTALESAKHRINEYREGIEKHVGGRFHTVYDRSKWMGRGDNVIGVRFYQNKDKGKGVEQ